MCCAGAAPSVPPMQRSNDPITELRRAIDLLPVATREAMLAGVRGETIIVGAYTDDTGGVCPMLAAHRHGGRTTLLAFANSWDRFAGSRRVRRASRRELTVLESQLTQSLAIQEEPSDLAAAIAEHAALKQRAATAPVVPAVPAAEEQIRAARLGGGRVSWLRPRRAGAERALAHLDEHVLAATR